MHREWDDETREKVASAIISTIGNRAVIDILLSKTKDAETKAIIEQKLNGSSSTTSSPKKSKASESHADVSFESSNYTSNFDEAGEDEESDEYSALFNDL